MITAVSLVNFHPHNSCTFFSWDENLKIYSLSNCQIYNTVLLTIVTMLYITFLWHLFPNWTFVPFDPIHPFYPHLLMFLVTIVWYFSFFGWLISLSIMLLRSIYCCKGQDFLLFCDICEYFYIWHNFFIHSSIHGRLVVSIAWLL